MAFRLILRGSRRLRLNPLASRRLPGHAFNCIRHEWRQQSTVNSPGNQIVELNKKISANPMSGELFFLLGLEYHKDGAPEMACNAFQRATDLSPREWKHWFNLASVQQELGRTDSSIRSFEVALKMDPSRVESYSNLALAYKQKGRHGDAIALLKSAIEKHPNAANLYNNLAIVMIDAPNVAAVDAVKHARRAVELEPRNPQFLYNLATALRESDQFDESVKVFETAISILKEQSTETNSEFLAEVYHNLALCLQRMGQIEVAAEKWKKCLATNPSHKESKASYIAALLLMQDDYNASIQMKSAVKDLSPQQAAEFYTLVATAVRESGRPEIADQYYRRAMEVAPSYPEPYLELGVSLCERTKFDQAIPLFAKVVSLAPTDARAWNYLGAARRHNNDVDGAIEAYKMSLKADPNFIEAVENLAFAYQEKNEEKLALELYEQLVKVRPNDADLHSSLASLYQRTNQPHKAVHHHQIALRLNPDDWISVFNSAMQHYQAKEMDKANELFEKAIKLNPDLAKDFEPFRQQLDSMPDFEEMVKQSDFDSDAALKEEMKRFESMLDDSAKPQSKRKK